MMLELKLDNSVIPFATPKLHLGQAVCESEDKTATGYIIGIQRDKYTWQYLVFAGMPPTNDADETWHDEANLEFIPVKPAPPQNLDTLRIAS
jgi:hypothetical protein